MRVVRAWASAPGPVRAGAIVLGAVSAYHLTIAAATALLQPVLRTDLAAQHPDAPPAVVEHLLGGATLLSLSVHLPLFVLTGLLAATVPTGHPLALRPATVSQLFGIAFAYASTPPFTALHPLIPLVIALQALVIALLWTSPGARHHYAHHPRSTTSKRRAREAITDRWR